jgi:DinB family protein
MPESPDRAATLLARFNAAQSALAGRLRDLPAAAAEASPSPDVWTAAQIGWHVAVVNDYLAGVLMGSTPGAEPASPGFREGAAAGRAPQEIDSRAAPAPPAIVGRDSALEKLRASGQYLSKAMAALTPARGSGYTITLSAGAVLSLYEAAEFAGQHVIRHVAQIDRTVANV